MRKAARNNIFNRQTKKIIRNEQNYLKSTRENIINKTSSFDTLEAYRSARTNIIFSLFDEEGCKKLIITSAMPGDGKTTTCINLALTFAHMGSNILVIDADLRCPRVHSYFDIDNEIGLSNLLVGLAQIDSVIQSKEGIDVITAGHIPQNPAELLSSKKMGEILDTLSKRYDYIFIDTPPVGLVADAVNMAKNVSGVIIVARQNYTIHKAINEAIASLKFANSRILGFIVNDSAHAKHSYRKNKYGYYKYIT
ncbi:MAG: Tyrosine-protein kinase YwqD [Firmicutes bacterium ADurb.Bin193]|nr:MAG: Tyrosine-protein kinase YwqD [Firmicutes bacterium ADurb.Bin193]